MTFATPEPVVSGRPERILHANGHEPRALDDFVGGAEFTIELHGHEVRVIGVGVGDKHGVRFHQKDDGPDGKDVRLWRITGDHVNGWFAEPTSAF